MEVSEGFNAKSLMKSYDSEREFLFQVIYFTNKTILQIHLNGEIDYTIDLQLPKLANTAVYEDQQIESMIGTNYIIGNNDNYKILIMSTQIGKLFVKDWR
ncbi:hypothetical protein PACTADRAFT_18247 [Pachysolen tannophilus NRRL Y-2460]|uniref:Uncharacterized protein n=1 Tax=Pachysolen tannophilus NRRL Y-2460 TaxID=669874 RepID=A0A1E4TPG2_PACTA|nr:hypothetical protein PACTADRAFT_18247 [Pachysolen tannophilus NRRL Y-2460]